MGFSNDSCQASAQVDDARRLDLLSLVNTLQERLLPANGPESKYINEAYLRPLTNGQLPVPLQRADTPAEQCATVRTDICAQEVIDHIDWSMFQSAAPALNEGQGQTGLISACLVSCGEVRRRSGAIPVSEPLTIVDDALAAIIEQGTARRLIEQILYGCIRRVWVSSLGARLVDELDRLGVPQTDRDRWEPLNGVQTALADLDEKKLRQVLRTLSHYCPDTVNWSEKDFNRFEPHEFEELVTELFDDFGYESRVTPATADKGVDIVLHTNNGKTGVLQVKQVKRNSTVGLSTVQRLGGTMAEYNADWAAVLTTGEFSKPGIESARRLDLVLIDLPRLLRLFDLSSLVPLRISE